jgi:hypothetical protein
MTIFASPALWTTRRLNDACRKHGIILSDCRGEVVVGGEVVGRFELDLAADCSIGNLTWRERLWPQRQRSRDKMLECYLTRLRGLDWSEDGRLASLNTALEAVDLWAEEQIRFYDAQRGTRMFWSATVRGLAWLSATFGIIVPLAAPLWPGGPPPNAMGLGYVLLALAAALAGLNALFGITASHVRVSATQMALEQLIVETHARWCSIIATGKTSRIGDARFAEALALIHSYGCSIFAIVRSETAAWGEATIRELDRFDSTFQRQRREIEEQQTKAAKENERDDPPETREGVEGTAEVSAVASLRQASGQGSTPRG